MKITESNGAAISFYGLCCAWLGATVLYASVTGGVPMPPQSHGGAIYEIPAEAWGIVVVGQGFLMMLANVRGWLVTLAITSFVGAFLNGFIAYFASEAAFGFIVSRGAFVYALLHGAITLAACRDLARCRLMKYQGRIK